MLGGVDDDDDARYEIWENGKGGFGFRDFFPKIRPNEKLKKKNSRR